MLKQTTPWTSLWFSSACCLMRHIFSSTRSRAVWAGNWFRWRWPSLDSDFLPAKTPFQKLHYHGGQPLQERSFRTLSLIRNCCRDTRTGGTASQVPPQTRAPRGCCSDYSWKEIVAGREGSGWRVQDSVSLFRFILGRLLFFLNW